MMCLRYIIVRSEKDGCDEHEHDHEEGAVEERKEKEHDDAPRSHDGSYGPDDALIAYMKKNGNHFTNALAAYASKQMKNANKTNHIWTIDEVKSAFGSLGYDLPSNATWGDAAYAANMYYADFSTVLKSETDAVRMANAILHDADGYEGQLFVRYAADVMQTKRKVPWDDLM